MQLRDADLRHELRQLPGKGRRDPIALTGRRLVQVVAPDSAEAGLAIQVVAAEDTRALEVIEAADEGLRGQEDDRLDTGNAAADLEVPGGPLQLGLEFLALEIRKVQRVLDRPGLVPSRNSQAEPLLVATPGWLLISTRAGPPGVAMNRSTSRTWPLAAVNVNDCQARYGSASGISPLM